MTKTILSVFGLTIAGAVFFFFTQPTYDTAKAFEREIEEYNQALNKAAELQQLKQSLLSRYNAFNPADIDRLHKLLPDHVDNVRLVLDLDSLAARNGLAIQNVVVSDNPSQGGTSVITAIGGGNRKYDSLILRFSTRGAYQNFTTFMRDLETSLRIVDLISLNLERDVSPEVASLSPDEPIYRYSMTIKTYWLK